MMNCLKNLTGSVQENRKNRGWKCRCAFLAILMLLASLTLTGCGEKELVVATINKEEIGISEAVFYTRLNQQQWELAYTEAFGREFWTQSLGEELGTFADELKRQVMETICQIHVLNAHAEEYGIKLSKEEKKDVEARVRDFMESHSEAVKAAAGAEEKLVEELLTERVLADKVTEAMVADYVPQVTQEEAALGKMVYCLFSTLGTYDTEGNHMPVSAEEAQQIAADAAAFAGSAQELQDLEAAALMVSHTCIDVYFNETSNGGAHEKVAEVLRTMEVGQVSDPIETEEGYYVIQYVSEYDEEATKSNMDKLAQVKLQERFEELYEQWRSQTEISIDWEVWDTVQVDQVLFVE